MLTMKHFNKIFPFFVFLILALFPLTKINAVTLNPAIGTYAPGSQVVILVTASPGANDANAVALRFTLSNATVVSFTPITGGSWVGATQDCAGPAYFTSTTVCASLAKSVDIVAGETLGTLVIQLSNTPGTATITKAAGNAYSDGVDAFANTGGAAVFTISSTAPSVASLPNTAFIDGESGVIVAVSFLLVAVGIILIKLKPLNTNLEN